MQSFEDKYIKVQGMNIRYWQEGQEGPYLILVHGIGACAEYWHANIASLSKHYRVIAVDMPGFGKSDKPDVDYSLEFYELFLAGVLDALQIPTCFLMAHSLGGAVAIGFTLDHPERVKKLILVDNVGFALDVIIFFRLMALPIIGNFLLDPGRKIFAMALRSNVYDSSTISDEFADLVYSYINKAGTQRTMRYIVKHNTNLKGIRKQAIQPLLSRYDQLKNLPILLFWGKQDHLLPYAAHIKAAKELIPHAEFVEVDRCGHILQMEHPDFFNQHVLEFLNG